MDTLVELSVQMNCSLKKTVILQGMSPLGGGFSIMIVSTLPGEVIEFDSYCSNGLNKWPKING